MDPEAYEEPYGGDIAMRNNASNVPATGVLGPLIGAAIGGAVAGTQNASFNSQNKGYFGAVEKNTPKDLGKVANTKIYEAIKADSFFKSRLRSISENQISSHISSYRLIRIGKNDSGELTFAPQVYVQIELKDRKGNNLVGKTYIGTGLSAVPITEYASSAAKSKQAYTSALDQAIAAFQADVALKMP